MTATANALAIRALRPEGEDPALFAAVARLLADAYPIMRLTNADGLARQAATVRDGLALPGTASVIAERDGAVVGAMRLYDYVMNVHGRDAPAGGVGSVAVARDHKRRGIARALIAWYLDAYRRRGAPFAVLHPFRFDFYRALGFGYGTPVRRYRLAPHTLRDAGARGTVRILDENDLDALLACHERVRATTHGFIAKHRDPNARTLADPALRVVGVEDGGELRAFMLTTAVPGADELRNRDELAARDLVYEDEPYLAALLGHLRAQQDQFARVTIETQDEAFFLASTDPRDGSDVAVAPPAAHRVAETALGMMYRIIDVPGALSHLPPSSAALVLRIDVEDAFFAPTAGSWTFRFGPHGAPKELGAVGAGSQVSNALIGREPDATLAIGIADFSSVVMGSLRLRDVVRHRLATVEPRAKLAEVDAAFRADRPPVTMTRF